MFYKYMILYVVIKLQQKIDFKFHKRNHDVYDTLNKATVLLTVKKTSNSRFFQ